jgi:hypothetical protein
MASKDGLRLKSGQTATKGDPLAQYEYAVQVKPEAASGNAGIMPVWVDDDNWLRLTLDPALTTLTVTGTRGGDALPAQTIPLPKRRYAHRTRAENGVNLQLADRTIIFCDGIEVATVEGAWPDSSVACSRKTAPGPSTASASMKGHRPYRSHAPHTAYLTEVSSVKALGGHVRVTPCPGFAVIPAMCLGNPLASVAGMPSA